MAPMPSSPPMPSSVGVMAGPNGSPRVAEAGLGRYVYEGQDRTDDLRDYNLAWCTRCAAGWISKLGYRYRDDDSDADNESFDPQRVPDQLQRQSLKRVSP